LPLPAVTGKSGNFTSRDGANLTQAYLRHHAFKSGSDFGSRRRAAQILVDDFDLLPAEYAQAFLHRVLQFLAFQIVIHLVER